jgi:hypothetical protein
MRPCRPTCLQRDDRPARGAQCQRLQLRLGLDIAAAARGGGVRWIDSGECLLAVRPRLLRKIGHGLGWAQRPREPQLLGAAEVDDAVVHGRADKVRHTRSKIEA